MPTWILDQFLKEWPVIKQAPLTLVFIMLLSFGLAFLFLRWLYQDVIKRKDDLIADLGKKPKQGGPDEAIKEYEQNTKQLRDDNARLVREKEEASRVAAQAREGLVGEKQEMKEVQRTRDRYLNELAGAKEQIETLQGIRVDRDSLKSKLDELTTFKVVPVVDIEPRHSDTGHRVHSAVFIAYDALVVGAPPDKLLLKVDLRVRFDNQVAAITRIRGLTVLLRRETEQGETRETKLRFSAREEESRSKVNLGELSIQPAQMTSYYRLDCEAEIDKDWARMLDEDCFLRIVMEAIQQPRYCIDLSVDWGTARLTDSLADLTLRRRGECSG